MDDDAPPELIPLDQEDSQQDQEITAQSPENNPPQKVPITIVTGFLGSGTKMSGRRVTDEPGKTTLLQHILTSNHGKRIAVILNEFGDSMGIEKTALNYSGGAEAAVTEEWLELRNGCLCCSVKDSGVKAIENLLTMRGKFDYILLETTGLADPGPIAALFWMDEALQSSLQLDGIVTVVDSKHVRQRLSEEECIKQIAAADRVIVNKTDLISDAELSALQNEIMNMNGVASMRHATFGRVDLDFVLDLRAYAMDSDILRDKMHRLESSHHHPDARVKTVCLEFDAFPLSMEAFEAWLQRLLWEKRIGGSADSIDILRFKAFIKFSDQTIAVYQAVGETYDCRLLPAAASVAMPTTRLVFIGRNLDYDSLKQSISCYKYKQ